MNVEFIVHFINTFLTDTEAIIFGKRAEVIPTTNPITIPSYPQHVFIEFLYPDCNVLMGLAWRLKVI